jgi:hypothetical protein
MKKLLFALIPVYFVTASCKQKLTDAKGKQPDYSWLSDTSKAKVYEGDNYLIVIKKGKKPIKVLGEILSADAVDMVVNHETQTVAMAGRRAFSVEYDTEEFIRYISNWGGTVDVPNFRVYFGYNSHVRPTNPNRFTALLVAVDKNGNEIYNDQFPGLKIIDLGTICPTMCGNAPADARSLYYRAGLPNQ